MKNGSRSRRVPLWSAASPVLGDRYAVIVVLQITQVFPEMELFALIYKQDYRRYGIFLIMFYNDNEEMKTSFSV